eukprot:TRINITY_DN1067_c1_g2_i2.p1 TRINITY_DN1067_c1_g2~~TRINITY_DN1067_c1_g2_i2.p1  ORF type:complete len:163 (-),score=8.07 TRINITY_DN1067_c1_g2_i2:82-570(-)
MAHPVFDLGDAVWLSKALDQLYYSTFLFTVTFFWLWPYKLLPLLPFYICRTARWQGIPRKNKRVVWQWNRAYIGAWFELYLLQQSSTCDRQIWRDQVRFMRANQVLFLVLLGVSAIGMIQAEQADVTAQEKQNNATLQTENDSGNQQTGVNSTSSSNNSSSS